MRFQDHQIRQYLLGDLPESDESEIEIAYFRDPDLLARVEVARDDLADDYAALRLSPSDREKFERRILATADGVEQVAISRALRNTADAPPGVQQSPSRGIDWRWLSLAAVIPLAIGSFIVWRIMSDAQQPAESARATQAPPGAGQSSPSAPAPSGGARTQPAPPTDAPPAESSSQRQATVLAMLVLTADLERSGGQAPTLLTSSGATHVDLVSPRDGLPQGAGRARVDSVDGTRIWSGPPTIPEASARDPRPRARVPVSALPPGDYFFSIESRGPTEAPRYFFRVRAR